MIVARYSGKRQFQTVADYIRARKASNERYVVVDVGGAANPAFGDLADIYVDIRPVPGQRTIVGDINDPATWEQVLREQPDFVICSHTLEDIRDPNFVIGWLNRCFRAGFIAMPNKHTEMSSGIESDLYPGYAHHRWVFTLNDTGVLRAIAKMPVTALFASAEGKALLSWLNPALVGHGMELGFVYEDRLELDMINGDYAGHNVRELIDLYRRELAAGL